MSQELINDIIDTVNGYGVNTDEIEERVHSAHPALQRMMLANIVKPIVIGIANAEITDRRNDVAVSHAESICDELDWDK